MPRRTILDRLHRQTLTIKFDDSFDDDLLCDDTDASHRQTRFDDAVVPGIL